MLQDFNDEFLNNHTKAGKVALKSIDAVIIYKCGYLSLWMSHDDKYQEMENVALIQKRYTHLKQICHIPVSILTTTQQLLAEEVDLSVLKETLGKIWRQLNEIAQGIQDLFVLEDLPAQQNIIDSSLSLIEEICNQPDASQTPNLLTNYFKNIGRSLAYNQKKSTEIQILTLHQLVRRWEEQYNINLKKTRALIVGTHGPRNKLIESLYFNALYSNSGIEEPEDNRVYYVEMLPSQMGNIDCEKDLINGFLAGSEINKTIGKKMLGGKKEMFSDVLHDYAPPILDEIFSKCKVESTCQ